jgi:hypothetical protein
VFSVVRCFPIPNTFSLFAMKRALSYRVWINRVKPHNLFILYQGEQAIDTGVGIGLTTGNPFNKIV